MNPRLEALEQLGRLRDQKVLSEAEFEIEKSRLLSINDGPEPAQRPAFVGQGFDGLKQRKVWIPLAVVGALAFGAYFGLSSVVPFGTPAKLATVPEGKQTAQPASLSAILKFERADQCVLGSELKALFADLRSLESGGTSKTVTAGLNGPTFRPDVLRSEQNNAVIARLTITGVIEGLHVIELRTTRFDASDAEVLQIRFAESPELVRTKLNGVGFTLPKPDELKSVELDEGRGLVYGIERLANGTALTCASL